MTSAEAIQYIRKINGFVPFYVLIDSYENEQVPDELIQLSLGLIHMNEIKTSNPKLYKKI